MNVFLWILQAVLAGMFLMAGAMKLMKSRAEIAAAQPDRMGWIEHVSDGTARLAGGAEVLGALGLILPAVTGVAPVLVPLAAAGLAVTMILAAVFHSRRGESQAMMTNIVLAIVALIVVWGRFGDYAF
jgi:uncharacterized membrane protein YphA (DoxX/SURF4 family)